jgi:hypothetical protein
MLFAIVNPAEKIDCDDPSFAPPSERQNIIERRCAASSSTTEDYAEQCFDVQDASVPEEQQACGPGTNFVCPRNSCCGPDGTCGTSDKHW